VAALATVLGVLSQRDYEWVPTYIILSIMGFCASALLAFRAAAAARDNVRRMGTVKSKSEVHEVRQRRLFKFTARGALWMYTVGLSGLVLLVLRNLYPASQALLDGVGLVLLLLLLGLGVYLFQPLVSPVQQRIRQAVVNTRQILQK
jgi:hypothetical protein